MKPECYPCRCADLCPECEGENKAWNPAAPDPAVRERRLRRWQMNALYDLNKEVLGDLVKVMWKPNG